MIVHSLNILILEEKTLEISNRDLKSIKGVIVHSLKTLELIIEASSEIFTIDMTGSFTEILALLGQKSQALTKKH